MEFHDTNGTPMAAEEAVQRPIYSMTDREIAEETLFWLRQAGATIAQFQNGGMSSILSGMMGSMFGGKKG